MVVSVVPVVQVVQVLYLLVVRVAPVVRVRALSLPVVPNGSTIPNIAKAFPIVTMPPIKNTTGHRQATCPITIPSAVATVAQVRARVILAAATIRALAIVAVDLEAQVILVLLAA